MATLQEVVLGTVEANTGHGEERPATIDAHHIRVHLCANGGYDSGEVNRTIAKLLEVGQLQEVETGRIALTEDGSEALAELRPWR